MMTDHNGSILLTGATGFIGSHAARALAGEGAPRDVVALVRPGTTAEKLDRLRRCGVITVEADISDHGGVNEAFSRHAPARVLHLAALRGAGRGSPDDYHRVNVVGTETLLKASVTHGVETFIHCSSVGVHGTIPREQPTGIDAPVLGDSGYHRSKIDAENVVDGFIRQGLDAYIVRPTITYGTGDTGFPATLVRLVQRRRLPAPDPEVMIHLLDVNALCRLFAILLFSGNPGGRTIIAADRAPVRLTDLVNEIHRRYRGRDYPRFPALPSGAARLLSRILGIVGSDTWRTRVQLISESWCYRVGAADLGPDFAPPDTLTAFPESMCR